MVEKSAVLRKEYGMKARAMQTRLMRRRVVSRAGVEIEKNIARRKLEPRRRNWKERAKKFQRRVSGNMILNLIFLSSMYVQSVLIYIRLQIKEETIK